MLGRMTADNIIVFPDGGVTSPARDFLKEIAEVAAKAMKIVGSLTPIVKAREKSQVEAASVALPISARRVKHRSNGDSEDRKSTAPLAPIIEWTQNHLCDLGGSIHLSTLKMIHAGRNSAAD